MSIRVSQACKSQSGISSRPNSDGSSLSLNSGPQSTSQKTRHTAKLHDIKQISDGSLNAQRRSQARWPLFRNAYVFTL